MARGFISAQAESAAAMVVALNAQLATLVNPSILRVDFDVQEMQRRSGRMYSALVTYDDGGASLATPFKLSAIEAPSAAALITALNAFITSISGQFAASTQYRRLYTSVRTDCYIGLTIYNATSGASANWTPL